MTGCWRAVLLLALLGSGSASHRNPWQQFLDEYKRAAGTTQAVGGSLPYVLLPVPLHVLERSGSCGIDVNNNQDSEDLPVNQQQDPPRASPPRAPQREDPPRTSIPDNNLPSRNSTPQNDPPLSIDYFNAPKVPSMYAPVDLLRLYREQSGRAPQLPPAVFDPRRLPPPDAFQREFSALGRAPPLARPPPPAGPAGVGPAGAGPAGPEPPRFKRSLMIKAELTVPKSDYTEPYNAWWDAATGAARVDHHGGTASSYRLPQPGNLTTFVHMWLDRSGPVEIRRCLVSEPISTIHEGFRNPTTPDLRGFVFAGYEGVEGAQVERWRRGEARAGGGAPGELLTYTHDFLLTRDAHGTLVPLKYSVVANSSIIGPGSDRYEHRYISVQEQNPPGSILNIDIETSCEHVKMLNASLPVDRAMLEPLRQFLQPHRDPAYDESFNQYKRNYGRTYANQVEEAVRSNVLMESTRFVNSLNRQGAPFSVGTNHLSDRLQVEMKQMYGVDLSNKKKLVADPFPESDVEKRAARLPASFDWRNHGAVTPARDQGGCMACWAFAIAAAVEGALFINTRKLQALSEKALLDCGYKTEANDCEVGTYPHHGFDYIERLGLPAREDYTPYKPMTEQCRDDEVPLVTKISGHVKVPKNNIAALKLAIRFHAPTVVLINGKCPSLKGYTGGVLEDRRCMPSGTKDLNHAVTAVGWGSKAGEPHFIVKNSWSSSWGEDGFARLHAATNACGVLAYPSYPRLERADVLRGELLRDQPDDGATTH